MPNIQPKPPAPVRASRPHRRHPQYLFMNDIAVLANVHRNTAARWLRSPTAPQAVVRGAGPESGRRWVRVEIEFWLRYGAHWREQMTAHGGILPSEKHDLPGLDDVLG